jgi:hypothetical protein
VISSRRGATKNFQSGIAVASAPLASTQTLPKTNGLYQIRLKAKAAIAATTMAP